MGAQLATTNKALVDKLVDKYFYKNSQVEGAFRAVDRAMYYELEDGVVINPYDENPWRLGNLHLSAPCIYAKVVDAFNLEPGMSFLNLGSGTGYLNTIVGLLIGPNGINHGIEIHADVVEFANKKLGEFMQNSSAIDKYDFSEPIFIHGNFINLNPEATSYDRIYLGAGCLPSMEAFMKKLVKPNGGILIMPYENRLMRHVRLGENEWQSEELMKVYFTMMIGQSEEDKATLIEMPRPTVKSLKSLCRIFIRQQFRNKTNWLNPNLLNSDNVDRRRHRRAMATLAMRRAEQQRQQAKMIASMSSAASQLQSAASASRSLRTTNDGTSKTACRVCHSKRHQRASKRKCCKCCNRRHRSETSMLAPHQDSGIRLTRKDAGARRDSPINRGTSTSATRNPTRSSTNTRMMTRFATRQLVRTDTDDAISTLPGTSTTTSDRNQTTDNDDHNSYTTPNEHSPGESSGGAPSDSDQNDDDDDDAASSGYANMCNILDNSSRGQNDKSDNKRHQRSATSTAFRNENYVESGPTSHRSSLLRQPRASANLERRSSIEMFPFQAFTFAEILHDQPMAHFMRYRFEHQFGDSRRHLFEIVDPVSNEAFNSSYGDDSSSSSASGSESESESRYSEMESDMFVDARQEDRRSSNNGREPNLGESLNSFLEHAYATTGNINDDGSSNDSDDDDARRTMERDSTESDDWSLFESSSSESSVRSLCSSVSSTSSVWGSDLYEDDDDDDEDEVEEGGSRGANQSTSHDEPVASRLRSKLVLHREPWRQAAAAATSSGSSSSFRSAVSQLFPLDDSSARPSSSSGGRAITAGAKKMEQQSGASAAPKATSARRSNCYTSPQNELPGGTNKRQRHSCNSSQLEDCVEQSSRQQAAQASDHNRRADSLLLSSETVASHRHHQHILGVTVGRSPSLLAPNSCPSSSLPVSRNANTKPHNLVSRFSQMTRRFGGVGGTGRGNSIANRAHSPSRDPTLQSVANRTSDLSPALATLSHEPQPVRELRSTSVARPPPTSGSMASGRATGLSVLMPEVEADYRPTGKQDKETSKLASQRDRSMLIGRKRKRQSSSDSSESSASSPYRRPAVKSRPIMTSGISCKTRRATRSATGELLAAAASSHRTTESTLSPTDDATMLASSAVSSRASSSGPSLLAARRRVVLLSDKEEEIDDSTMDSDNHLREQNDGEDIVARGSVLRKQQRAGSIADRCDTILLRPARLRPTATASDSKPAPGRSVSTVSPHSSSRKFSSVQAEQRQRQAQPDQRAGAQNILGVNDVGRRRCIDHHRAHRHHHHHHRHHCHHRRYDPRCRFRHDLQHRHRHRHQRHRTCRHRRSSSCQHTHHLQYLCRNHRQTLSQASQQQPSLERELLTRRRVERERRVKRGGGSGPGLGASGLASQAFGNGGERARTRQKKKKKENECEKYRSHISGYIRRLQVPLVLHDYLNFGREFI